MICNVVAACNADSQPVELMEDTGIIVFPTVPVGYTINMLCLWNITVSQGWVRHYSKKSHPLRNHINPIQTTIDVQEPLGLIGNHSISQ